MTGDEKSVVNGSGAPPVGWDPVAVTERLRREAHAYPEHIAWLAETDDKGQLKNKCGFPEAHDG